MFTVSVVLKVLIFYWYYKRYHRFNQILRMCEIPQFDNLSIRGAKNERPPAWHCKVALRYYLRVVRRVYWTLLLSPSTSLIYDGHNTLFHKMERIYIQVMGALEGELLRTHATKRIDSFLMIVAVPFTSGPSPLISRAAFFRRLNEIC